MKNKRRAVNLKRSLQDLQHLSGSSLNHQWSGLGEDYFRLDLMLVRVKPDGSTEYIDKAEQVPVVDGLGWAQERQLNSSTTTTRIADGVTWGRLTILGACRLEGEGTRNGITETVQGELEYLLKCQCGRVIRVPLLRFPGRRVMRHCLSEDCAPPETQKLILAASRFKGKLGRPRRVEREDIVRTKRSYGLYLPMQLMDRVQAVANERRQSISVVVEAVIEVWMEEQEQDRRMKMEAEAQQALAKARMSREAGQCITR